METVASGVTRYKFRGTQTEGLPAMHSRASIIERMPVPGASASGSLLGIALRIATTTMAKGRPHTNSLLT